MTSVKPVCIYTRISSDDERDGLGVARQEKDCRALADRLGMPVGKVYCDNDLSAYTGKRRPEFEAMLTDVARGRYSAVLAWHPDRLYRAIRDLEGIIDVLDTAGVLLHTVNGGQLDLSTASGKMVARILGSVARQESEHKAERIKAAFAQRAEAGGWFVNTRVFGYTMDGEIVPEEAALIRKAAVDVLAGAGLRSIMRDWNARGIKTAKGNQWGPQPLKRLMTNPRHAGLCEYQGKVIGPGQWEAIIHPDDHAGLVTILTAPDRGKADVRERKYIGSYRYVCGICSAPMQHFIDTSRNHKYRCSAQAHIARTQPPLDELVESVALRFLSDDGRVAALLADAARAAGPGGDVVELRARRAALKAQKDELATLLADGLLDGPAVRREATKLTGKIDTIDGTLAGLARRSPVAALTVDGHLDEQWGKASADIKGKIIDELFTVVIQPVPKGSKGAGFNPDFIDIVWHR